MLQPFIPLDLPRFLCRPNLLFDVASSAEAELVQGRGLSVVNCGVKPLPGGLGGSNSLTLVEMVLDCPDKSTWQLQHILQALFNQLQNLI